MTPLPAGSGRRWGSGNGRRAAYGPRSALPANHPEHALLDAVVVVVGEPEREAGEERRHGRLDLALLPKGMQPAPVAVPVRIRPDDEGSVGKLERALEDVGRAGGHRGDQLPRRLQHARVLAEVVGEGFAFVAVIAAVAGQYAGEIVVVEGYPAVAADTKVRGVPQLRQAVARLVDDPLGDFRPAHGEPLFAQKRGIPSVAEADVQYTVVSAQLPEMEPGVAGQKRPHDELCRIHPDRGSLGVVPLVVNIDLRGALFFHGSP